MVGGRACPGSSLGAVVKVRLRDDKVTALTDPSKESDIYHVSTRSLGRPGWAYVSYYREPGKRFSDEIIAVKLDGSGAVERYAHMHTAASSCYRCEAHPSPSPSGRRVMFASNWSQDCTVGCGSPSDIKDYVVSNPNIPLAGVEPPAPPPPAVNATQLSLDRVTPNPTGSMPAVRFTLVTWEPASLELVDLAGRRVMKRELGSPGPGRHEEPLAPGGLPALGVYWLRLAQGGRRTATRVVFVR